MARRLEGDLHAKLDLAGGGEGRVDQAELGAIGIVPVGDPQATQAAVRAAGVRGRGNQLIVDRARLRGADVLR